MESQRKYWFPAKRYGWGWGIYAAIRPLPSAPVRP
jgi:hypothetical protein